MRKLVLLTAILMAALIASAPAMAEEILSVEPEPTVGSADKAPAATPDPPAAPAPPPDVADDIVEDVIEDTVVPPATETGSVQDTDARVLDSNTAQSEEDSVVEDTNDNDEAAVEEADKDSGDRKTDDEVKASGDNEGSGNSDDDDKGSGKSDDDDKGSGKSDGDDKGSGKSDDDDKGSGKNDDDGVEQDSDQDADSGDVDQDIDIVNTGNNVNLCIGIIQAVNTGNIQGSNQVAQKDSEAEEVKLEDGSSISVTPQLVIDCRQIIYQIVTGQDSDGSKDKVSKTGASKLTKTKIDLKSTYFRNSSAKSSSAKSSSAQQVRTGGSGTQVISTRSDAKTAQRPNATRKALPRTGGLPISYAAVLGLCVGAPLIGGGLLLHRISR